MMKSYLDLVAQSGRVHRRKNRVTVLCVAVAVCLVTAIFGLADMQVRTQTAERIRTHGNWHVAFLDIDPETAELIGSRADVAVSGWMFSLGSRAGYKINGKTLAVAGVDEPLGQEIGLTVAAGRYPSRADECLLDRQALSQFSLAIGDRASITLPDGSSRTFTIVGTYADFASLKAADAHGLLLTCDGLRRLAGTGGSQDGYYVQFKKGARMRAAIDAIKANHQLSDGQVAENTALLALAGESRNQWVMQLYLTAGVLFILVLAAGVLMIASSFNMSVLERIQFFGLLRCLGATRAQIQQFVLLEGLRFSFKGIPLGLVTGTAVVWAASAFLKYVNPAFFRDMPLFGLSWPSLVSGTAVGFLTVILASLSPCRKAARVSPLCAVTGNIGKTQGTQAPKAVRTGPAPVEIALGIRHATANRKNLLLLTSSFAISIILFLSFSILLNFMHQALKPLRAETPDISITSGEQTSSLDRSLLSRIKEIPGVERVYGRMFAYDIPAESGSMSGSIILVSFEENQFGWAKKKLRQGNIDQVAGEEGKVLVVYAEDLHWQVGDTLTLKLDGSDRSVKIAGMLSAIPFDRAPGTQILICSEPTFTALTGAQGYTIIDLQLARTADEETVAQIRSLTTPQMKFSDRRQGNAETRTAFYSFAVFAYGFLVVIALITLFNILNSMNISVSTRINQYGVMRAVGMSGRQLHRMVVAEAAAYAASGCLAGCLLGLPLHRYLFRLAITSHWGVDWQPPLAALAVILVIAVLTAILSVIGPVRRINRMDIVKVINIP